MRASPRRRLARNYAYFVFEYNLLSFERGPRLFATFARFSSLVFPLHSLPLLSRFYLLFRDTRPVVKLIDPLWLRCRVHATTNSRTRHRVSDHASFVVRKWTNWRVRWLVNEGWMSLKNEAIVNGRKKRKDWWIIDWWIYYKCKLYNDIFVIIGINIYSNSYCNWSYFIRLGLFNVLSAKLLK